MCHKGARGFARGACKKIDEFSDRLFLHQLIFLRHVVLFTKCEIAYFCDYEINTSPPVTTVTTTQMEVNNDMQLDEAMNGNQNPLQPE